MKDSIITTVIFDLGNVLVDFNHTIAAKKIASFSDKTPQEIYRLFFESGVTGAFEEGKISPLDFFGEVKKMLNLTIGYEEFLPIWNEIFTLSQKNLAVYSIAKKLKKKYKVAVLSNINVLHFDYVKNNFTIFDAFHKIIASCDLGVKKPQKEIYDCALEILEASPENVFYTDDRPELVNEARRFGINAFVFETPKKLKKDLASCGIKIS